MDGTVLRAKISEKHSIIFGFVTIIKLRLILLFLIVKKNLYLLFINMDFLLASLLVIYLIRRYGHVIILLNLTLSTLSKESFPAFSFVKSIRSSKILTLLDKFYLFSIIIFI